MQLAALDVERGHLARGGLQRVVDLGRIGAADPGDRHLPHGHQRGAAQPQIRSAEDRERGDDRHRAAQAEPHPGQSRAGPPAGEPVTRQPAPATVGDHARRQSAGNATGPNAWTSGSSSIPKRSATRRRPSAITETTSAVLASPWLTTKFACLSENPAPPIDSPRQPAASSSPAGAGALGPWVVGVLERRAERLDARGLGLAPAAAQVAERCLDLLGVRRAQREARPRHDLAGAQRRAPVGESKLVGRAARDPRRADDVDPLERARQLSPVGVGVHPHGAADGAGDVDPELDPAEPQPRRVGRYRGQPGPTAAVQAGSVLLDVGEIAIKLEHQSADAVVRYEQVRP